MDALHHSWLSARDFGGKPEDYLPINRYLDSTKLFYPNSMHRMFLHNSFGMKVCEDVFGNTITNSEGVEIPVREIARQHIIQDCGKVPTLKEWVLAVAEKNVHKFNNPSKEDLEWIKKQQELKKNSLSI